MLAEYRSPRAADHRQEADRAGNADARRKTRRACCSRPPGRSRRSGAPRSPPVWRYSAAGSDPGFIWASGNFNQAPNSNGGSRSLTVFEAGSRKPEAGTSRPSVEGILRKETGVSAFSQEQPGKNRRGGAAAGWALEHGSARLCQYQVKSTSSTRRRRGSRRRSRCREPPAPRAAPGRRLLSMGPQSTAGRLQVGCHGASDRPARRQTAQADVRRQAKAYRKGRPGRAAASMQEQP